MSGCARKTVKHHNGRTENRGVGAVAHGKKRDLKRRDTASEIKEALNKTEKPDHSQGGDSQQDEDFMIAADLTLYSNPVNRFMASAKAKNIASAKPKTQQGALPKANATKTPSSGGQPKQGVKSPHDGHETIAADLTLYRGPMAALDAMHEKQRVRNIQEGKKDDHHHYNKSTHE